MIQNGGNPWIVANNGVQPYGITAGLVVVRDNNNNGMGLVLVDANPAFNKLVTATAGAFNAVDPGPGGGGWYAGPTGLTNRTTAPGALLINAVAVWGPQPPGAAAPGQTPYPIARSIGYINAQVQPSPFLVPASQIAGYLWITNTGLNGGINPQIIQLPDINTVPLGPNNEPGAVVVFQRTRLPTHGGGVKIVPFSGQTVAEDSFLQFHGPGDSIELTVDRQNLNWVVTGQHLGHARWETIKYTHTIQAPYSVSNPWGADPNKWSELRGAMAQFFTDITGADIGWVLPPLADAGANYLTSGCIGVNRGTTHNVVIKAYAVGEPLRLRTGSIVTSITVPPGGIVKVTADGAQNWVDLI